MPEQGWGTVNRELRAVKKTVSRGGRGDAEVRKAVSLVAGRGNSPVSAKESAFLLSAAPRPPRETGFKRYGRCQSGSISSQPLSAEEVRGARYEVRVASRPHVIQCH